MKLALIQEKQNRLYHFKNPEIRFTGGEQRALQREMIEQNLQLLREAAKAGADLALTSEAINFPGRPSQCGDSPGVVVRESQDYLLDACKRIAAEAGMYLVTGMMRAELGGLYNAAVVFDRGGKEIFCYHKNFLAGDEKGYLTPGDDFPLWDSEFGKIGIGICWDMQFPETARSYGLRGADLILCPTWGWESVYGSCRAYENGIYVAAAMAVPSWKEIEGKRTPSQVIAPDARVLAEGSRREAEVVYCEIKNPRDCKPFRELRFGDLKGRMAGTAVGGR